ncbi:MATE family efflux transporter [Streptomyces sp. NPDC059627]
MDLSGAVAVFVARHTGSGNAERARRVLLEALRICVWATLAESLLVILVRHRIAGAFTTDASVRRIVGLVFRVPTATLLKGPLGLDGIIWAVPIGWFVGLAYTTFAVRRYVRDARRFIPVEKVATPTGPA